MAPGSRPPGIVFLHWGQGDSSEFLSEACFHARAGTVCLLLDAPWIRPDPWRQPGERIDQPAATRRMYAQTVVDVRRGLDLLVGRLGVDPGRLAYVGHSFGATWGGVLVAVEPRLRAAVLMGGLPSLTDTTLAGARRFDDLVRAIREQVPPEMWAAYRSAIEPVEPGRFIGEGAGAAVLFQFGRNDSWISPRAAHRYYEAAQQPKAIRWYATGHEFTDPRALRDRAEWLRVHAGTGSIRPQLEAILRED